MTRVAVDTNVFVYRVEPETSGKRTQAEAVVNALQGRLVVPVQVLAETSRVLLARRRPPLPPSAVRAYLDGIRAFADALVPLTFAIVDEALRGVDAHGLSYYDAQIWAVAKLNQLSVVLSEDFQAGATLVRGSVFWIHLTRPSRSAKAMPLELKV